MPEFDSDGEPEAREQPSVPARPAPAVRNEDLPALFWDEMPDNAGDHPDMVALKAIDDECTPEDRARSFKDQGNKALKTGLKQRKKFYIRQAIEQYNEGLGMQPADKALTSVLYANRAQANLILGNFRNALLDGQDAVRFDPGNVKAYFRAAKGAMGIDAWDKCYELCAAGLEAEPDNAELIALAAEAKATQAKRQAAAAAEAERQFNMRAPARELADTLLGRGWRIGRPQFGIGDRKPVVAVSEGEGEPPEVIWPVLFFYPEASMENDAIEEFGEHDTFAGHLDVIFGPEAPPLRWDAEGRYRRDTVQVYYLSHSAKPLDKDALVEALHGGWPQVLEEGPARYGDKAAKWVRVKEDWTLGEALSKADHVVPGVPVFFVLAADTPFRESFLAGDVALL